MTTLNRYDPPNVVGPNTQYDDRFGPIQTNIVPGPFTQDTEPNIFLDPNIQGFEPYTPPLIGPDTTEPNVPPSTTDEFILPKGEDLYPYSGLPEEFRDMLLKLVMPSLQGTLGQFGQGGQSPELDALSNLINQVNPGINQTLDDLLNSGANIDESTNQALNIYRTELDNFLQTQIPKQIGKLANRGILRSSDAENILSDITSKATTAASTKGYETALNAAKLKSLLPSQNLNAITNLLGPALGASVEKAQGNRLDLQSLTGLINLARSDQDPTVLYRAMADLIASI